MRDPWKKPEAAFRPVPEQTVEAARADRRRELGREIQRTRSEFDELEERASTIRFKMFQYAHGVPVGLTSEEHALQVAMSEVRVKLSRLMNEYALFSSNAKEQVMREGKVVSHA